MQLKLARVGLASTAASWQQPACLVVRVLDDLLQPTASRAWRHSLSNRVRVVMAQHIDGQSISVPPFCKAKTSKNSSEALLRCKGCAVDFSKRSHNFIWSRGSCVSASETSLCSARRDIVLLPAEQCHRAVSHSILSTCGGAVQVRCANQRTTASMSSKTLAICATASRELNRYMQPTSYADCCPLNFHFELRSMDSASAKRNSTQ